MYKTIDAICNKYVLLCDKAVCYFNLSTLFIGTFIVLFCSSLSLRLPSCLSVSQAESIFVEGFSYTHMHIQTISFTFYICIIPISHLSNTNNGARFDKLWLDCIFLFFFFFLHVSIDMITKMTENFSIFDSQFLGFYIVHNITKISKNSEKTYLQDKTCVLKVILWKLKHIQSSLITMYDSRTICCGSRTHEKNLKK